MLVWRDTGKPGKKSQTTKRRRVPPHLVGADIARVHTDQGDLVALSCYVQLLGHRSDVDWVDVADGWQVAQYGIIEPQRYLRTQYWTLAVDVVDGNGGEWEVPAILAPNGVPCINMRRRLTDDGWIAEPFNDYARAAIEACESARPYALANWEGCETDQKTEWLIACLEAVYHLDALTIAKLGLVDDTLCNHGLKHACGAADYGQAEETLAV